MNDERLRMRALFIANGGSRRNGDAQRAVALLRTAGMTLDEPVLAAASHDEICRRTKAAVAEGIPLVVVGGGDGTFTSIVGNLAGGETVLGVLPLGTGNSFARSLRIPQTIAEAVETIVTGRVARIDLGRANGTYFANFATIGFTSDIGQETDSKAKQALGTLAYVAVGAKVAAQAARFRAVCTIPGRPEFTAHTYQLIVTAGRVFGTSVIDPSASSTDGKFDLFVNDDENKLDIARTFLAFLTERQHELPHAHHLSAARIRIETDSPQRVNVDGEALGETPVDFEIDPGALRVIVPRDVPDGEAT